MRFLDSTDRNHSACKLLDGGDLHIEIQSLQNKPFHFEQLNSCKDALTHLQVFDCLH